MEWYIWYGMVSVVVVLLLLAAAGTNTILWKVPSYMTARAILLTKHTVLVFYFHFHFYYLFRID